MHILAPLRWHGTRKNLQSNPSRNPAFCPCRNRSNCFNSPEYCPRFREVSGWLGEYDVIVVGRRACGLRGGPRRGADGLRDAPVQHQPRFHRAHVLQPGDRGPCQEPARQGGRRPGRPDGEDRRQDRRPFPAPQRLQGAGRPVHPLPVRQAALPPRDEGGRGEGTAAPPAAGAGGGPRRGRRPDPRRGRSDRRLPRRPGGGHHHGDLPRRPHPHRGGPLSGGPGRRDRLARSCPPP